MKKVKKAISVLLTIAIVISLIIISPIMPETKVNAASVTRDDGVWLFPLSKSYYNSFSDWAGCSNNVSTKCGVCGGKHASGWGDSSHTDPIGHNGIDVSTGGSNVTVMASAAGKAYTFNDTARGNTVVIEHKIGDSGYSYYSYYQHLSSFKISNGATVKAGQTIGLTGTTGYSTGIHLHFGIVMGKSNKATLSYIGTCERKGWILGSGFGEGRILNNPASSNPAGNPTKSDWNNAVVAPLNAHYGSTHYTFTSSDVAVGPTCNVTFMYNDGSTTKVTEKFIYGVANQKFGYNPDGTAKYSSMLPGDQGFGKWSIEGYKLLGWSTDSKATTATYSTYSAVTDNWISGHPNITLYAVWERHEPVNGWKQNGSNWLYYTNDVAATGWKMIGSNWYYFNSEGIMQTGWLQNGGNWYFLKSSGEMLTGWQYIGGSWYYLKSSGAMATGWLQVGNSWYYFKSSGEMTKDWQYIGGNWYYFKTSGEMVTGWQQIGGKYYYFCSSGVMARNTYVGPYHLNSSGVWDN